MPEANHKFSKKMNELLIATIIIYNIGFIVMLFSIFYRFRHIIKVAMNVNDLFSDSILSDNSDEINKREFRIEKIKNGESITNNKTQWTEKRLQDASDKTIDRLYEKYHEPIKINETEALEYGKPFCPIIIYIYAEGIKRILNNMPCVAGKYQLNEKKFKEDISKNKLFYDNLAIKIGSKMIEKMGRNSPYRMGFSLSSTTWGAIVKEEQVQVEDSSEK